MHSKHKKDNLVLIQAFPANSLLSEGIIKYLSEHFQVYFIDLPGFIDEIPPLKKITIKGYTDYIEKKIESLELDEYILGGISFGALLANYIRIDEKCKAILSAEPYLGYKYIKMDKLMRLNLLALLNFIRTTKLDYLIWNSKLFYNYLIYSSNLAKRWVDILYREVDARTFFRTARLLLTFDDKRPNLHDRPYILLINPDDKKVDFDKIIKVYRERLDNNFLRIIVSELDHYPDTPTYNYFKKTISGEELNSLVGFLEYIQWFEIKNRKDR